MNPRIERVREDIKRTEGKLRELEEYLKSLRIRERQLCDEELIKVMRTMAGKDGDVIALLDDFQRSHDEDSEKHIKSERLKSDEGAKKEEVKIQEAKDNASGTAHLAGVKDTFGMTGSDKNENGGM